MSRALTRTLFAATFAGVLAVAAPLPAVAAAKKTTTKPAPKPARYVVVGTFASYDGTVVTLAPTTGGNAKTRPAPVTFTVAANAVVVRDDVPAMLSDLVAGDHVAASGTKTGTVVTITKVMATSPEVVA